MKLIDKRIIDTDSDNFKGKQKHTSIMFNLNKIDVSDSL